MTAAVQSEERTTTAQAKKQYIAEIANLRAKLSNALGEGRHVGGDSTGSCK